MKYIISILLIFCIHQVHGQSNLKKKYPNLLLTDDFGILNAKDLHADPSGRSQWQCFETKNVTFNYNTWKAPDPMGANNVIVDLCLYSFQVKSDSLHYYGGRRANRLTICKILKRSWIKFTKNQTYICLYGESYRDAEKVKHGKIFQYEKSWIFHEFKTLKGYSY
jgi:hypothetical protein